MKVVVIGATGNVGTAVVDALVGDPQVTQVVGIARRLPDEQRAGVTYVAADVSSDDLVPHLQGADAVVHLAWVFQPTHRPTVTWRINAVGSARVLEAAGEAGVHTVVYASSIAAYSPADGRRVDESWPTHSSPTAGYSREKAYVERLVDVFEARHPDVRVVRLRPSFIFQRESASQQRRLFAGPLLPTAVLQEGRLPVVPWPSGMQFQALHTRDIAEAYRLAVVRDDARGAYNVASEPVIDGPAVARLLGAARVVPVPGAAAHAALAVLWRMRVVPAEPALLDVALRLPLLDTTRIRTELGWEPQVSSTDAMAEVLEGMVEHAGAGTGPLAADPASGGARWGARLRELGRGVGEHSR